MSVYCAVHAVYVYLQLMQTVVGLPRSLSLDMLWSETFSGIVFASDTFCCGPAVAAPPTAVTHLRYNCLAFALAIVSSSGLFVTFVCLRVRVCVCFQ